MLRSMSPPSSGSGRRPPRALVREIVDDGGEVAHRRSALRQEGDRLLAGRAWATASNALVAGRRPNQISRTATSDDRARADQRAGLAHHLFGQRGTFDRRQFAAAVDEIDDRNLDRVAALLAQAGRRGDQLLDVLDLLVDRLGRRLVAERSGDARRD